MGGSYPGALAAWARYKYPHIIDGAIASSAVVNAIDDMWQYDTVAYEAMMKSGPECPKMVEDICKWNDLLYETYP
jgi:hypothetical protein